MRLKVKKSKFLTKGPVPKKAKVASSSTKPNLLTFNSCGKKYGDYLPSD